jgi:5-methylcytosine-specific restriction endonuclease McrA
MLASQSKGESSLRATMSDLTLLTRAIVDGAVGRIACGGERVSLRWVAELYEAVGTNGSTVLHHSVRDVLLRMAETHLLAHPRFKRLLDVWDGILGTAHERIRAHLEEILGVDPDPLVVERVFRSLSGSAAQRGRKAGEHNFHFQLLIERLRDDPQNVRGELRCQCCGFHFRVRDLSNVRARTVLDLELKFAKTLFPGRNQDEFKPVMTRGDESLTTLTVDHIIPEASLGWSTADNLTVLCRFCNQGKLAFYRPLEALSAFAIGGLADFPAGREVGPLKSQIIVAALRSQRGQCSACGVDRYESEMTVRPTRGHDDVELQGFAPWNLQTICYYCIAAGSEQDFSGKTIAS